MITHPMDAFVFDCDSTLSSIEGIDELAKKNGVGEAVKKLTHQAMSHTGLTTELYQQRLALVRPTRQQVLALGKNYIDHLSPNATSIIQLLQKLNKAIFIISAGLYPSLLILAEHLNIPRTHIFGVDIYFDENGSYKNFDHHSTLTTSHGKQIIVDTIKQKCPNIAYIGDGLNDLAVYESVTRFIGYGGCEYRKQIAERCEFYITKPTLAPILPLTLTYQEFEKLEGKDKALYEEGLRAIST